MSSAAQRLIHPPFGLQKLRDIEAHADFAAWKVHHVPELRALWDKRSREVLRDPGPGHAGSAFEYDPAGFVLMQYRHAVSCSYFRLADHAALNFRS